jgi:hypothetical protein
VAGVIAALYIDPRGPYPKMDDVDCWDEARDATLYPGPWPVVAHPPCGPWGRLRHLSRFQHADCGPRAVEQVRAFCGVLEHPCDSRLWRVCDLPPPGGLPDAWGGYTVEVCQVDWGHVARKRTWLYIVRVPRSALVFPPPREPTHWVAGGRVASPTHRRTLVPPGIKVCSAQQRRRTPPAFAEYLVSLARASSAREVGEVA